MVKARVWWLLTEAESRNTSQYRQLRHRWYTIVLKHHAFLLALAPSVLAPIALSLFILYQTPEDQLSTD